LENRNIKDAILEKKSSSPSSAKKWCRQVGPIPFIVHCRCIDPLLYLPRSPTAAANHDPFVIDSFLKDYDFSTTMPPSISGRPTERTDVSYEFTKIIVSDLKKHSWLDLQSRAWQDLPPNELILSPSHVSRFNSNA
jgi:hypothetical protein